MSIYMLQKMPSENINKKKTKILTHIYANTCAKMYGIWEIPLKILSELLS